MKNTYLKSFFLATIVAPMLPFASDISVQKHLVEERVTKIEQGMEEGKSACIFGQFPPVYYSLGTHTLSAISALGDSLEIEDGSVWKISSFDASKICHWKSTDLILITQNHRWFSKYKYRLVNQTTGSTVEANLSLGPIKEGEYTRYVVGIDNVHDEIILSDKSRWRVSPYDRQQFEEWLLNDAVIIGYNSGWDSGCHGLLINVNMNECIRAEQF